MQLVSYVIVNHFPVSALYNTGCIAVFIPGIYGGKFSPIK